MAIAIIVWTDENIELLRFTETKLFFDAKNISCNLFSDCIIIKNESDIEKYVNKDELVVVIKNGYYLTTNFRKKIKDYKGLYLVSETDQDIIIFDSDTRVSIKKKSKYKSPSKQNYIIENLLKVVINSKKILYYDNTEPYNFKDFDGIDNLYGLASGWKTVRLARDIGLHNLKNIIVYDYNAEQLNYAKQLHSEQHLPSSIPIQKNAANEYKLPEDLEDFWPHWHRYPVQFCEMDLFNTPKFLENSLVWISNVFNYEPNIFNYGWQENKLRKNNLILNNLSCIIIES